MNCDTGCGQANSAKVTRTKPVTVGENLDMQIAAIRKALEEKCIAKAKAEAMQMLDFPLDEVRNFVQWM